MKKAGAVASEDDESQIRSTAFGMSRTSAWLAAALRGAGFCWSAAVKPISYNRNPCTQPLWPPQFADQRERRADATQRLAGQGRATVFFQLHVPMYVRRLWPRRRTILNDLGSDAQDVTFLFVTVDPAGHARKLAAVGTDAFHPGIIGLTEVSWTNWRRSDDAFGVLPSRLRRPIWALS